MDKLIRENEQHKVRVEQAMSSEVSAKAFRAALRANEELQAAAINPETCVIDVWTAYIWRFLLQRIFAEDAILEFYSGEGQNATYYIKNLDEIAYLMTQAKPPAFGKQQYVQLELREPCSLTPIKDYIPGACGRGKPSPPSSAPPTSSGWKQPGPPRSKD